MDDLGYSCWQSEQVIDTNYYRMQQIVVGYEPSTMSYFLAPAGFVAVKGYQAMKSLFGFSSNNHHSTNHQTSESTPSPRSGL